MSLAAAFPEITQEREPIAPHTHLKIGGPAEFFVRPRTVPELAAVLKFCKANRVPVRMLGGGFNLLVRDDPIPGAVLRLDGPAFAFIEPIPGGVRSGGGTPLYDLIAHAVRAGLGGLETLVGIRGSVGGSVRCNVGDRSGEIAAAVRRVAVLAEDGGERVRGRDELTFSEHKSDLDEAVILWVEFALEPAPPEALLRRMRTAWVTRKQAEPLTHQAAVRLFRNPPGAAAATLIDRAGLAGARVGGAEISERNANYLVAHPGTTAKDILTLIDRVRGKVREVTGVPLDQELHVW
jgi:UDP-N-acetylmuramate dehydrogenase